jgi:hypothetical protein
VELYMVVQDGRPLHRGLSRSQAERTAAYLARGYESHRANDKRRVAEFEIKPDKGMIKELDEIWTRKD